uniref:Transmembrane 4 L6 family member 5-like n=1 Tax=Oryzias melastigma TaxID=30732 RepID=A0A3B3DNB4_ORYME
TLSYPILPGSSTTCTTLSYLVLPVCILCNILLLFPDLKIHFLLEKHVTKEATWATGLWASGLMVCTSAGVIYSGLAFLAAAICCYVSATGLVQGPKCLYNTSSGLTWGVPLKFSGYLHNQTLWSGVCLEPRSVVQWNVVLFSVMGATSALEAVLCAVNILNSLLASVGSSSTLYCSLSL